ncbi:MAG: 30S ribosomal protein S8 [Deltaproteobacteria bacterium]|nr:MAG: 30S ribosomal protein S8 [Deltaproteobacteria bacterium]
MAINDHISNMLTRIRNAQMAGKKSLEIPSSKMLVSIAAILQEEGYIEGFKYIEDGKQGILRIQLKYSPVYGYAITGLRRVSKPGRRVYVGKDDIPQVKRGYGICILSTSKGVVTGEKAKEMGVGGELLCEIW